MIIMQKSIKKSYLDNGKMISSLFTWIFLEGNKQSLSHQGHWAQNCLLPRVAERRRQGKAMG